MSILQRLATAATVAIVALAAAPAMATQSDRDDDALRGSGRAVPADVQHHHCTTPENPLCVPKG